MLANPLTASAGIDSLLNQKMYIMKTANVVGLCVLLTLSKWGAAQPTEGLITYEETIKLEIELPPEMAQYALELPTEKKQLVDFYFNASASVQKNRPKNEVEIPEDPDNEVEIRIERDGQNDESVRYTNIDEKVSLLSTRSMGKLFLIESAIKEVNWKLTGEQKQLLGYPCQKATAVVDSKKVEAWFTSSIPVSMGPIGLTGLPGLILELSLDEGSVHFVATNFEKKAPTADDLKRPKKGKRLSKEAYDELMRKRMAEMGGIQGGRGTIIIETDER